MNFLYDKKHVYSLVLITSARVPSATRKWVCYLENIKNAFDLCSGDPSPFHKGVGRVEVPLKLI